MKQHKMKILFSLKTWIVILVIVCILLLLYVLDKGSVRGKDQRDLLTLTETLVEFYAKEERMPTGWEELEAKDFGHLSEDKTIFFFPIERVSRNGKEEVGIEVKDFEVRFGLSKEEIEQTEKLILVRAKDKWYRPSLEHPLTPEVLRSYSKKNGIEGGGPDMDE